MKDLPIRRGINFGDALEAPYEGAWSGHIIRDEYFKIVKEVGFDHIRIPIKWSVYTQKKAPYSIEKRIFDRVDHLIEEGFKNNLYLIINVHHYEEIMENPLQEKERFLAIWRQISEHYKDYPDKLYFELLNEPTYNLNSDLWNQFLKEAVEVIRRTNPERKIIVGPDNWNSLYNLEKLMIPENDENIIVTFHYYNPFPFTHQGAGWVKIDLPIGVEWLGTEEEKKEIERELDIAVSWAREHGNIPLYMGEFGVYYRADMESRVRWTDFVARSAEKRGIAWAYWEFYSGFGVFDPDKNEWRMPLLKALIPE